MDQNAYTPEVFRLPFPPDYEDEPFTSVQERASALCGAAEAIFKYASQTGQEIAIPENAKYTAREVFAGVQPPTAIQTTAEQIHLTALLQAYDITVVQSAQQLRNFCTNILIEKAASAKSEQSQLRAVEMLGKIKDVALFEERSTILIEHMTTEQIQNGLREKINRMRSAAASAATVDITPTP